MDEHARRAVKIAEEFQAIIELRKRIDTKFKMITTLMEQDSQPAYAIEHNEQLRVAHKIPMHMELVYQWDLWSGYASARRDDV